MRAELADLETRRRRNLQAYQAGAITLGDLAQQNAPLVARDAELRAQMAERGGVPDGVGELGALRPGAARRLVASLRNEPVEAQLLFLSRLYEAVEIHRGYVLVRYAGGVLEPIKLDSSWVWHGEDSVPW